MVQGPSLPGCMTLGRSLHLSAVQLLPQGCCCKIQSMLDAKCVEQSHGEGGSLGAWLSATGWVASSGRFPPVSRPQVFFSKKRGLDLILQGSSLERSLQGPAFGVCGRASAPDFRHSPGPLRGRFSLRPPWAELRQCGAASQ